jgi:hypothetical protein
VGEEPESNMAKRKQSDEKAIVFTIEAAQAAQLQAWRRSVEERYAKQRLVDGALDGVPIPEHLLETVRQSIERREPQPYYGAIGGAYIYSFCPTGVGCTVKVRHSVTGEEVDLTSYDEW